MTELYPSNPKLWLPNAGESLADYARRGEWDQFAAKLEENNRAIEDHRHPSGSGKPYATFVVAASDTLAPDAANADYVCDGTADQVEINEAIAALGGSPGRVLLLDGTFHLSEGIVIASDLVLQGQGMFATRVIFDQRASGNWFGLYNFAATDRVQLSDFTYDGDSDTALYGIYLNGDDHVLRNLGVENASGQNDCVIDASFGDRTSVIGCRFSNTVGGFGGVQVGGFATVTGNEFVDIDDECILAGPSCTITANIGNNVNRVGGTPPSDFIQADTDSIVVANRGVGSTATATISVGVGGVDANNVLT